jgi:nitrogen regulatory protein PII
VVNVKKFKNHQIQNTNMKILTPKEKALDIIHKICRVNEECSISLAMVFVNEIISETDNANYWERVKSEIVALNQQQI